MLLESKTNLIVEENNMKYVVILGDGMADEPIKELGNKTPLQYANKPMIDYMAKHGEVGIVYTIPEGMTQAVIRLTYL